MGSAPEALPAAGPGRHYSLWKTSPIRECVREMTEMEPHAAIWTNTQPSEE